MLTHFFLPFFLETKDIDKAPAVMEKAAKNLIVKPPTRQDVVVAGLAAANDQVLGPSQRQKDPSPMKQYGRGKDVEVVKARAAQGATPATAASSSRTISNESISSSQRQEEDSIAETEKVNSDSSEERGLAIPQDDLDSLPANLFSEPPLLTRETLSLSDVEVEEATTQNLMSKVDDVSTEASLLDQAVTTVAPDTAPQEPGHMTSGQSTKITTDAVITVSKSMSTQQTKPISVGSAPAWWFGAARERALRATGLNRWDPPA